MSSTSRQPEIFTEGLFILLVKTTSENVHQSTEGNLYEVHLVGTEQQNPEKATTENVVINLSPAKSLEAMFKGSSMPRPKTRYSLEWAFQARLGMISIMLPTTMMDSSNTTRANR